MAVLQDTSVVLGEPLLELWQSTMVLLPGLIAAILILIFGYLVGALIGAVVKKILVKTKVVSLVVDKIGLKKEIGKWNLTGFLALITKWYIFIIFLNPAAQVVSLHTLSNFFNAVALWIPNIILAVIIVMAGYVLAEYLAKKIKETKARKTSLLASAAKLITMVFVVLIALKQIGINVSVAESTFLIILAGVMLGLAIAFGLGMKDEAKDIVRKVREKI
ncbi:hypothetical protein GF323_04090 [Candidatus Woesearchaeota archaeon]|nr:hypothetical protein [Candidatus Woesearchaeota archaeon]